MKGKHTLPFMLPLTWMTPSGLGLSAFVCVGISVVCLREVTGWDCHVKNPLGLCCLSVPHTLFLSVFLSFLHAIHLAHTKTHTQLNYMSRWSVEFICNLLRSAPFSPSLTTEAVLFLGHHFTLASQDSPSITPVFPLSSLCPRHPLMSLFMCQNQRDQTREGLWMYACILHKPDGASNYSEYGKCIRKYIYVCHVFTFWLCLHVWCHMAVVESQGLMRKRYVHKQYINDFKMIIHIICISLVYLHI